MSQMITAAETGIDSAVGGNGGNAAANAIQEECEKQGVLTLVAACPKSIDSDILVVCACNSPGLMTSTHCCLFWELGIRENSKA